MSANHRRPVLQSVDQLLWSLVNLEDSLSDLKREGRDALVGKVNQYVEHLDKLKNCSALLEDDVPLDLVDFLDGGGNPDVFTRDLFIGCVVANQESKGKVVAFRSLRDTLASELKSEYPEEWRAFEAITSQPESSAAP
ncbi:hypothetical protein BSKO_03441 [Bryopsis sp. KO-2023]|nr:hypothetical protein BSKO_03441 [Bryopsis sp. KO-2023]